MSTATTHLVLDTDLGIITLRLLPELAPQTVGHITKIVNSKLYDGTSFYRSDFVIQFGLHGSGRTNPHGNLQINETGCAAAAGGGQVTPNTRGTASVAHFDVPDCGGTELFINLGNNKHLDSAYGGYCVFALVEDGDATSLRVVDDIAAAVKARGKVGIRTVTIR